MNARTKQLQLTVESRQLQDAASCIFHTLLLHRTTGKFHYSTDVNYKIGCIGLQEIQCEEIDLTYVRVNSPELISDVEKSVSDIGEAVRNSTKTGFVVGSSPKSNTSSPSPSVRLYGIEKWETLMTAPMKLEFYQKRKRQWPMPEDHSPWEVWDLNLEVVKIESTEDFTPMREYVGERLGEIVLNICQCMNRSQYMPAMPSRDSLADVFDDRFSDCEPYLYRIDSDLISKPNDLNSRSNYMMRLLRDTMKFTG
ncbi:unnamed protein product [Bursaphelenchus xylophilus]|uniref:Autophagy-related protein 101 n=1 Tax=Bursaphelenchus xylophilus TaxID=6326 RepID=A0A1I7S439_BURXY|nr:unnamed protein product [Bursaphelenchus xylophilus]CAG9116691.1 unnamed protein product [Bursaphelenchus xylophilus]